MERYVEAQAPVNIAVIKYWGKKDERFKIPINDSLSGTLSTDDMCTTTSVHVSSSFGEDTFVLNHERVDLLETSPALKMLNCIRSMTSNNDLLNCKAHIVSNNNFPTAAGLASSAAGYACLAFALGHAYGVTDLNVLSKVARKGSGSACRSLYGGFVHWLKGFDHDTSMAEQVVNNLHWPEMRVIICVVKDTQKEVPSSFGMSQSVKTSSLIYHRAEHVVPKRIDSIKDAIYKRNFESFANITMQDSNQFHAICLDTFPPIFYLNETSRAIIELCHLINEFLGKKTVAYTFDAGPNACIYLLNEFVPTFIAILKHFFYDSQNQSGLLVKGRYCETPPQDNLKPVLDYLDCKVKRMPNSIKYLINTSIGDGPKVTSLRTN